jgi:hypothetical protein
MYCSKCGAEIQPGADYCSRCGAEAAESDNNQRGYSRDKLIGFSNKINDPAFARYIKNSNRYSAFFALGLAVIAIVGFTIAGAVGSDLDNPQAFFIGLTVGAVFVVIALIQIRGRRKSKTWDGAIIDKRVDKKKRKVHTTRDHYYWQEYLDYMVVIASDYGKKHEIHVEDDDTVYNYYKIGDRVRHHKGLNSYEKYDKSKDDIIFCAACAGLNDINDDYCHRCKCPLLK